jgi:hypothetical protein
MASKPKASKPKPYYEAKELIAELYGIPDDYEPPPYLDNAPLGAVIILNQDGEEN